ncbi:ABC transporter substrate-binding protein [Sutterella wadsworthensis]|uniref:ABC transporter substrate-binding protein n=1 Tax=Sutterella wadsworthensis TaxID=40545 RepID=UPI002431E73B|nr:ABC transporter substrate-binding protein [Sutterella wadsworthensis]
MPFNRRQMLQLMTSLAVTTACPAMAWEPESPVELELLHAMPGQDAYFRQVAEAFTAKNPKIRIRFRASPANYPEAHQSILRAAITNKLPDIYHSAWIYFEEAVRQLKKRNAICDVTDLFKAEGDAWAQENYYQSMIDIGTVDGRLYALPFAASTPVFFYNADLVKAAGGDPDNFPTEWEEIIRLGSAIKKLGNADGISFDVEVWPDDWLWQTLILEQGGSLMDKDGKHCGFNNDFGLNAMRLCRRIVTEGGMTMRDYEQSRQQFVAGKIGIIASSPNAARAFTDLVGSKFKLGCQIYPRMNKDHGRLPTGGNGDMILTKDPIKQRAAWEYLKFACGPEGQKIAVLGSGYMPTNKLAEKPEYLGDFYKKNPLWYTPIKQIPFAMGWQGYTGNNGFRIWTKQRDIIGLVMRGSITPEEGVRQIVSATESLF